MINFCLICNDQLKMVTDFNRSFKTCFNQTHHFSLAIINEKIIYYRFRLNNSDYAIEGSNESETNLFYKNKIFQFPFIKLQEENLLQQIESTTKKLILLSQFI
jgi:hypothetical protein